MRTIEFFRFGGRVALLGSLFLAALMSGCKKDSGANPTYSYEVTYFVTTVGNVQLDEIIYTDKDSKEVVLTGVRDTTITFSASSGFVAKLRSHGTFIDGGNIIDLKAIAPDLTPISLNKNDGYSGGGAGKPFDMTLEQKLP